MAKKGGLPTAILDMTDWVESKNIIIHADSGVGKTRLAGTLKKALILAPETSGIVAAKRAGSEAKVWPIRHWNDLVEAYEFLRDNPDHGFEWVVIDTLTDMQQKALRAILEHAVEDNPNRDPDIPAIQDHQKWQNMLKRFIADFCELPVNVCFTAQSMHVDTDDGDEMVLPLLLGKGHQIAAWACAQVGWVFYYRTRNSKPKKGEEPVVTRELICTREEPYFAKDRYGVLPAHVTIAVGDSQKTNLARLVDYLDKADPETTAKKAAVAEGDPDTEEDQAKEDDADSDTEEPVREPAKKAAPTKAAAPRRSRSAD